MRREVADITRKLGVRLPLARTEQHLVITAHLVSEEARVLSRNAAGELDARACKYGRSQADAQLVEILVRERHSDPVLAGLVKEVTDVVVEIVLCLVDIY